MANVRPIPEGYESAIPYLAVQGAVNAIDFYKKAFGATEVMRMADEKGKVGHAELKIGPGRIFLADEYPDMGFLSPKRIGGTPVHIHMYVEDVDAVAKRAVDAGAKVRRPVEDQFYGDRAGQIEDPFGHQWFLATRKENLTPDEMKRRAQQKQGK